MNLSFENKVALVTGAGSGMGLATAKAFAEAGAAVVLADFRAEAVEAEARRLIAAGYKAIAVRCDVSDDAQVEAMVDRTIAEFGRLDAAFNNAGVMARIAPTADSSREDWDRVIGVNLRGVWICMKYELRQMQRQGSGAIVNNASVGALTGNPGIGSYIASKHGVVGLTRTAALEYVKLRNPGERGQSWPDRYPDCPGCRQRERTGLRGYCPARSHRPRGYAGGNCLSRRVALQFGRELCSGSRPDCRWRNDSGVNRGGTLNKEPDPATKCKKEISYARHCSLWTARYSFRRSAGTYHHQTHRCDRPALGHMHLRIGPVALSRNPTDRSNLLPWVTSTAGSWKRLAKMSARSSAASL